MARFEPTGPATIGDLPRIGSTRLAALANRHQRARRIGEQIGLPSAPEFAHRHSDGTGSWLTTS